MMEPRPAEVKALYNYLLYVKFENGEEKIYDLKEDLEHPFYQNLSDENNFKKVKISGINVEWETGEDIAPEKLYNNSKPISEYSREVLKEIE